MRKKQHQHAKGLLAMTLLVVLMGVGIGKIEFEGSTDNMFGLNEVLVAAEHAEFNLLINGTDDPQNLVDISDLMPGDEHFISKTIRVEAPAIENAQIYLHIKDLNSSQGEQFEPEIEEETVDGEQSNLEDNLIFDLAVGQNPVIDLSDQVVLADASSCWIPLGTIATNKDVDITQSFRMHASVTNWAQGDTLEFTEEWLAQEVDDPVVPETGTGRTWDSELKRCVEV